MQKSLFPVAIALALLVGSSQEEPKPAEKATPPSMELGAFSVSLTVKDLKASRAFYEALGFVAVGGKAEQRWLVMGNGSTKIGLFQGMFEKNILTFNPGWSQDAKPLEKFTDVREIQSKLEKAGIAFSVKADPKSEGPAHFVLTDPDGNPVMFDQHVPAPKK